MDDRIAGDVARDRIEGYGAAPRRAGGLSRWRVLFLVWLGVNAAATLAAIILVPSSRVFGVIWLAFWGATLWVDASRANR